ncbi:MAG TPA: autotransporter-associated beta strand repeat-containing protein [Chthoniobacterales bacterium]|nr:autotransporter-associated beta strand repeat-containing protein [Chthoniobacterales bacterium]
MKPGNKGRRRLIHLLLLVCAGGIVVADNSWLTSVNFGSIQPANWFSDDSASPPADAPKPLLPARDVEKSAALPTDAVLSFQPASASPAFSFAYSSLNESIPARPSGSTDFFAAARSTSYALSDIAGGSRSPSTAVDAPTSSKGSSLQVNPRAQLASPAAPNTNATWIGPSFGSWRTAENWSPATVPNGAGVVADFRPSVADPTAMVTVHDVPGGLTVGTLSLAGTAAQTWNVRLSNPLIMNNNGNGALISNVNPAVGNYQLQISGFQFPLMLADNLAVTNTSGSTQDSAILIGVPIAGTGNITFNNVNNTINLGQIRLAATTASTFVGTSTVASGAVVFFNETAFGASTNQVILGSAGGGDATLVATDAVFTAVYPVRVASGSGGTLVLGTTSSLSATSTVFSGAIVLDGNVSLTNALASTAPARFTNTISGVGGITKIGAGPVVLSGNNSFTGATIVNVGTLTADSLNALGGTSGITVNSGGSLVFGSHGGTDRINDAAPLTLNGMGSTVPSLQTAGHSEHGATNNTAGIGALTLQSNSIIDLGNFASTIAFANSSAQTWTGTLSIYNYTPTAISGVDRLYFGFDPTGLTNAQLNAIQFYSDSGSTFLGTANWSPGLDGEIVPGEPVPVPEPATWFGGVIAFLALLWTQRGRMLRGQGNRPPLLET